MVITELFGFCESGSKTRLYCCYLYIFKYYYYYHYHYSVILITITVITIYLIIASMDIINAYCNVTDIMLYHISNESNLFLCD